MVLYNCQLQQWDEVLKQLDAAEKLAADVCFGRPLAANDGRNQRRRNEEARGRLLKESSSNWSSSRRPTRAFWPSSS